MISRLKYKVVIASTGKVLERDLTFQNGFGTITGPNETGKSFVLEMIRWALFGTAALRSSVSDFKFAQVEMAFEVQEQAYTVHRTTSGATLSNKEGPIASGTTPVNAKIVEILGFGLSVFDIACIANQGDIERLGSMKPTERKRMIDSVIGLNVIEDLGKWATTEAKTVRARLADLDNLLVVPEPPVRPDNYHPVEDLRPQLAAYEKLANEAQLIRGQLLAAPAKPAYSREKLIEAKTVNALWDQLGRLPSPPNCTLPELERWEAELRAWNSRPSLPLEEVEQQLRHHTLLEGLQRRTTVEKQIQQLMDGEIICPECNHHWTADDDRLKALQDELGSLPASQPLPTPLPYARLIDMKRQWEDLGDVTEPTKGAKELQSLRYAEGFRAEYERIIGELGGRERYDLDADQLLRDLDQWEKTKDLPQRLVALEQQLEGYEEAKAALDPSQRYEWAEEQFQKDQERYLEAKELYDVLKLEEDQWKATQKALKLISERVKQHLAPSLGRVASYFVSQMTGGERQTVVVDDQFNISVDDQALHTLSGSGKAVANLALRLALGQVLTNNVFSVFMGDEIDSAMDQNRSMKTADTLQTLRNKIKQILLVTHKYPEADYYIDFGKTDALSDGSHQG